jgi:geranylgeranyl pyrophosphate synthase
MTDRLGAALAADAAAVGSKLLSLYPETADPDIGLVYRAEKYSLMAGGKRIRPFLVMETAKAFSGGASPERREAIGGTALCFAAAVEMMHTFSLIHDDLPCMDDDDLRRGRPTSHKAFGEAVALLAGDSLAIRPFLTIMNCPTASDTEARRAAAALAAAAGSDGMIGGQVTDMRGETEKLDFDTLLKLHSLKTGAMIKVSCALGCIAAGLADGDPAFRAAQSYAAGIGLAFQIVDDVLDATADPAALGKNAGSDAKNGKTTFLSFMDISDARGYARRVTSDAVAALDGFGGCELLRDLAGWLLERSF